MVVDALTSSHGGAGLIFYWALLGLVLDMFILNIGYSSNPFYIVLLVVVPLIIIYLQEPLAELINGHKPHFEGGILNFLISGFFEMFVTLLEYLSHTVSFLRVGGFVLVHAGMMIVVETLAHMAGNLAPVVMIFGNIFVIALEGLIVGIQALRLNYYELFSRFYDAVGKPFTPLTIQKDTVEL